MAADLELVTVVTQVGLAHRDPAVSIITTGQDGDVGESPGLQKTTATGMTANY
jgi:hypothetical protein